MSTNTAEGIKQLKRERLGGVLLIAAAAVALVLANSPVAVGYQAVQHIEIVKEIAIFGQLGDGGFKLACHGPWPWALA